MFRPVGFLAASRLAPLVRCFFHTLRSLSLSTRQCGTEQDTVLSLAAVPSHTTIHLPSSSSRMLSGLMSLEAAVDVDRCPRRSGYGTRDRRQANTNIIVYRRGRIWFYFIFSHKYLALNGDKPIVYSQNTHAQTAQHFVGHACSFIKLPLGLYFTPLFKKKA